MAPPSRRAPVASSALAALLALVGAIALGPRAAVGASPDELLETETLENGLEVIAIPDSSLPIVTTELAVRHGAFAESAEFDGLAHLYEHMFFKGNSLVPDQSAYLKRLKELGIVFNGTTASERVNYFYTMPRSNLDAGLAMLRASTLSPKLDPDQFEKEKKIVLSEYDRAESHPQHAFRRTLRRELWYEHPSRKLALGTRETIEEATLEQMKTIQQRYYVPNNCALLVSGDVQPRKVFELAQKHFGDWERAADPFEEDPIPEHPPLEETKYVFEVSDVEVPRIAVKWQGPSVDESPEATYAADVLSFILGQSTSQFQQQLVDSGLALEAGFSYGTQKYTGPITASAQVRPENLRKAIRRLLEELHQLAEPSYYSDRQLQNAKSILAARDVYSREKTSYFTHTVSYWWAVDGVDYYLDYVENLREVTREDIADYVERYVLNRPFVIGVLAPQNAEAQIDVDAETLREIVRNVRNESDPDTSK